MTNNKDIFLLAIRGALKPTLVEDAEYAVEAAVLGEADVVRLQRRLDELERRLGTVEQRLPRRAYRKLERTARRVLSRG